MMRTPPLTRPALWAALCACALSACTALPEARTPEPTYAHAAHSPFIDSSRQAIDALLHSLNLADVDQAPVLVATVVNINDLARTAPLGRTLSELYASHLANRGLNVKEMKLRGEVYVQEGTGELLLSREIRDIARSHNAALVLVGTYSQAQQFTYLSVKLVRTADSRIMRSTDYAIPNDRDVQRLLGITGAMR